MLPVFNECDDKIVPTAAMRGDVFVGYLRGPCEQSEHL